MAGRSNGVGDPGKAVIDSLICENNYKHKKMLKWGDTSVFHFEGGRGMNKGSEVFERLEERGVSRRDFMKFCTMTAAALGLSPAMVPRVAEAVTAAARPTVIWLHFAECTGCSEAFLRTTYPSVADIILDTVSVDYHETIMAAAGDQAHEALEASAKKNKGKFILICEGAVMTADEGVWG